MNKRLVFLVIVLASLLPAQVYSPRLLRQGQPDSTDLAKFSQAICAQANAHTERQRAEAIWRYFLTDGRFVEPGFWYHIAGWTYEEPFGEVLDPIKLINSYGFGLCYHIAPLLEAVFQAAGFKDARCWFLTGHTVTEVFYDGAYHYFDSDMMGYNVKGDGSYLGKPVVSVRDLERQPDIILGKLLAPDKVKPGVVDTPWYPADVRASAMKDLAGLFTSNNDNYLYPYTRHADGHSMDFELRPGETLIRYFKPEEPGLYYLPYRFDGTDWKEFPQEIAEYNIKTNDGPRSQKDDRGWATGRFEYTPPPLTQPVTIIAMPSPYVIIDASFKMIVNMPAGESVQLDTSTDNGVTWKLAGKLQASHRGEWTVEPAVIVKSAHGRLTAVSGKYGYQLRISRSAAAQIDSLLLTSRVQLNPRSLPYLTAGNNNFVYNSGVPVTREELADPMSKPALHSMQLVTENGQLMLLPTTTAGQATYRLTASNGNMQSFDVGARFLDLNGGPAPDKLTAETRPTKVKTLPGEASIAWGLSENGPFHQLWSYDKRLTWRDGDQISNLLKWPEVFKRVPTPPSTKEVFVKIRTGGPAVDNIRLAVYSQATGAGGLTITQVWNDSQGPHQHVESIAGREKEHSYTISAGDHVENQSVSFSAKSQ